LRVKVYIEDLTLLPFSLTFRNKLEPHLEIEK